MLPRALGFLGDDAGIDFTYADLRHADFTRASLTTKGDGSNIRFDVPHFSEASMQPISVTGWSLSAGHPNANVIRGPPP